MFQRNAQTDHIWFARPKRFSGIMLLSLAASGVLLQLGSEGTEKDFFWDRFPHFSVLLIRSFGRGRPLWRRSLFLCKYRWKVCTCLQRHSYRPFDMLLSLKCIANSVFEMRKNLPKSLHMACIHRFFISSSSGNLKNPTYFPFVPILGPLSSTPCFLRCLLRLVLLNSAHVSTMCPPFMNKAYRLTEVTLQQETEHGSFFQ